MQYDEKVDSLLGSNSTSEITHLEALIELGRTTTAFVEAPPDLIESARKEYENALRQFNATGSTNLR